MGVDARTRVWSALSAAAIAFFADILPATSADLPAQLSAAMPEPARDMSEMFEARFGGYVHGVGSVERYTPDISAAIVTPRLNFFGATGYWADFIPRLQLGGNVNLAGRTSFAYLDILYTVPVTDWLFVEPFFGGAIHNGSLVGTPTLSDLGCRELFHVGSISIGT